MATSVPKRVFRLINQAVADNAEKYLWDMPVDGTCEVEFRPVKQTRKLNQNAALWAVAYPPILEHMGMVQGDTYREEIHEYFCGEFWGWKEYELLGVQKQRPKRSTTVNEFGEKETIDKTEMYNFYSFIQQRAAEHGIYVPDPDATYGMIGAQGT